MNLKNIAMYFFLFFNYHATHTNILLQAPPLISLQEVDTMAKHGETEFNWSFSLRNILNIQFTCVYKNQSAGFNVAQRFIMSPH